MWSSLCNILVLLHLSSSASQDNQWLSSSWRLNHIADTNMTPAVLKTCSGKEYRTSFSCAGRLAGYYADIETGCQYYHLCDSEGRRFTHACPNATLFQQRMMICDHWYMVDCSKAHHDYSANLLLGQRDKPFVSAEEHIRRHPVKELSTHNGALQHPNWFPVPSNESDNAVQSNRRARNRNTANETTSSLSPTLPEKYKSNIFLERLFASTVIADTATPRGETDVLELHLVDPRHMFYIAEDSAPSSDNNTILFIPLPSASAQITSTGIMKFRKQHVTSERRNPSCPKCHPEYLLPGKCEPCVVIR